MLVGRLTPGIEQDAGFAKARDGNRNDLPRIRKRLKRLPNDLAAQFPEATRVVICPIGLRIMGFLRDA